MKPNRMQPKALHVQAKLPLRSQLLTACFLLKDRFLLLLASLLGVLFSIYAANLTREALVTKGTVQSFCSIDALFDCSRVAASEAALAFGIPVALWGLLYYVWMGAAVLWTFFCPLGRNPMLRIALSLTVFAFAFSIYKAYQMLAELQVVCLVCTAMYSLNVVIMGLLVRIVNPKPFFSFIRSATLTQIKEQMVACRVIGPYLPALLSLVAVCLLGYQLMHGSFPLVRPTVAESDRVQAAPLAREDMVAQELARHFAQPKRVIRVASGAPTRGNPQAPITIVAFSDFQCPYCSLAAARLKELLTTFNGQVNLKFMHYPLDASINPALVTNMHPYAGLAARAAVYAANQGKFWPFHDDLFKAQEQLHTNTILRLAAGYGWNLKHFERALESKAIKERVKADIQVARNAGVQGTPSIYINGRLVAQWHDPTVLRLILRRELQEVKLQNNP